MAADNTLIAQAPVAARREISKLLHEIAACLADPQWDVVAPRKAALKQAASDLFAKAFLPLAIPGEWVENWRMDITHTLHRGDIPNIFDSHWKLYRRKGARGPIRPTDVVVATMPYDVGSDEIAQGQQGTFRLGTSTSYRVHTLAAELRFDALSWHYPGRTRLIALADPDPRRSPMETAALSAAPAAKPKPKPTPKPGQKPKVRADAIRRAASRPVAHSFEELSDSALLDDHQVGEIVGYSRHAVIAWRKRGVGPDTVFVHTRPHNGRGA